MNEGDGHLLRNNCVDLSRGLTPYLKAQFPIMYIQVSSNTPNSDVQNVVTCDIDTSKNMEQLEQMISKLSNTAATEFEFRNSADEPIEMKKRPSELNLAEMDTLYVR